MSYIYVPESLQTAGDEVRMALGRPLGELSTWDFLRAWCSVIYLFPGLQPGEFFEPDGGWPRALKGIGAEAWRRFDAGEITDNELYCYQVATERIRREFAVLMREKPWLFQTHFCA